MKYRLLIYEPGSVSECEVPSLRVAMKLAYADIRRIQSPAWKIEILPAEAIAKMEGGKQ